MRTGFAAILCASVFFVAATRGWCADTPGTNQLVQQFKKLSLEELMQVQVPTVYGASKHEQTLTEAPSDVTIVTADEIKKSGYRSLKDILNSVTDFYTTSDQAYDYIGTRGFNRPGDYGGRILIAIDGHRMNDDIFGSAAIGTEFLLDVNLIERVEVIRGPGSSLYGDNAVLAVINIITRRGQDFNGGEVTGSYGSYDEYSGRFSYGNRYTNGIEFALSGSYLGSAGNDNIYYPEFSSINNGHQAQNGASQVPNAFASMSYEDLSLEGGFVQRQKTVPGAYGSVFNDPRNTVLDERAFADLKFQHHFDNDWELIARIYYDHYRYDGDYPLSQYAYGDPLYPGNITINEDRDDQESLGSEVQISKTLFEQNRVTAGAEYRHDFILDQRNFDIGGPTYLNADYTADTVGIYVQDECSILRNLKLNAGARYDWFSSFGYTINPRVALIYNPCTNSTFKAIYGQAFRAPDAFELYYEAPGNALNQNLKPETIHSYEVDYDQVLNSRFQLVSSVFYYDIDDLISYGLDSSGNSTFGNIASATSCGGEMELDGQWAGGWATRLSYTYADARDGSTGQWLSDSPKNLGKFNLTAPLWHEMVFANFEIIAMSDRTTVQGNQLGGYWLANFTLYSHEIVKGLDISASVYNLFDKKYSDPVGSDFGEDSVQQDGRSFGVKLTYHF
jgi:iron complex outermembrane receptor protein